MIFEIKRQILNFLAGANVRVEATIAEGEAREISLQWDGKRHYIFGHETFEETVYITCSLTNEVSSI